MKKRMTGHRRVTVSLPSDLLLRIDRKSRAQHAPRSRVIAESLVAAERQEAREALEREVEEYYARGDPEGEAIAKASSRLARRLKFDDPVPRGRSR